MSGDIPPRHSQQDVGKSDRELLLEVHSDVRDMKDSVKSFSRTLYGQENTIGLVARVAALEKVASAATWLGGVLLASVLALVWALITGQASIVFARAAGG